MTADVITREMVTDDCMRTLFGQRLVTNIVRGTFVEAMVNLALRGWDFEHDGARLEVRQAASLQPWDEARKIDDRPIEFDIAPRTGHWAAEGWVKITPPRRLANVYAFAHHPCTNASADHREPGQWKFYIGPETALPRKRRISLKAVQDVAKAEVGISGLRARICEIEDQL